MKAEHIDDTKAELQGEVAQIVMLLVAVAWLLLLVNNNQWQNTRLCSDNLVFFSKLLRSTEHNRVFCHWLSKAVFQSREESTASWFLHEKKASKCDDNSKGAVNKLCWHAERE